MKRISFIFLAAIVLVACAATLAGCVAQSTAPIGVITTPTSTPETITRVDETGFYLVDGPAKSHNPVTTMVTLEITNMGDFDAKNVQAHVKLIYKGNTLDENTLNFGTVKVGMPVKKEFVMKAQFSPADWKSYTSASYEGMELKTDSITGDNIPNSYTSSSGSIPTLVKSTTPKYKKGDIIGDLQYPFYYEPRYHPGSDLPYMVRGYNVTPSGTYYTLEPQNIEIMYGSDMYVPSSSPTIVMEINEAEQEYPYLFDTYSI